MELAFSEPRRDERKYELFYLQELQRLNCGERKRGGLRCATLLLNVVNDLDSLCVCVRKEVHQQLVRLVRSGKGNPLKVLFILDVLCVICEVVLRKDLYLHVFQ